MTLLVNGEPRDVSDGTTIRSLLASMDLPEDRVAVELNRRIVRTAAYDTPLKEADALEVVTFVGGG